jgi:hypothetical protein
MFKPILILTFLHLLGCSTIQKQVQPGDQSQVPTQADTASNSVANETPISDVEFGAIIFSPVEFYSTPQERAMIKRSGELVNNTLHSSCFRDYMASRRLIETKNLSNEEIISQISRLSGLVAVSMYFNRWSKAMAYRQPPELKINLNRKYFSASGNACGWASTMAHETMHALLNFEHSFKWTPERQYSVPYSVGSAVEKCCKE